jgi:hypothetical protein
MPASPQAAFVPISRPEGASGAGYLMSADPVKFKQKFNLKPFQSHPSTATAAGSKRLKRRPLPNAPLDARSDGCDMRYAHGGFGLSKTRSTAKKRGST